MKRIAVLGLGLLRFGFVSMILPLASTRVCRPRLSMAALAYVAPPVAYG